MHRRMADFRVLREAEGAGGGGGAEGGAPAAAPGGAAAKWFEDARFQPHDAWLTAKGLKAVDDPVEALDRLVKVGTGAERLLGRGVDRLVEKPAEGASLAEWMRSSGMFGLPDSPEKYEIAKPELPKGVEWDGELEAEARKIAHEHGVAPAALNALIGAYGARLGKMETDAATQLQAANTEMMAALERDWGQAAPAKIALARSAAQAIGAQAGLTGEGLAAVVGAIAMKTGDAGVTKLFARLGEMMGEDTLKGAGGGAGGGFATTPAEARAKLAALDAPDGAFGKAFGRGDMAEMKRLQPERDALTRIAAGG